LNSGLSITVLLGDKQTDSIYNPAKTKTNAVGKMKIVCPHFLVMVIHGDSCNKDQML